MNKYRDTRENYYFEKAGDESIKDLSKSISFGLTFIFSFFMAGLTGYYFGTYFIGLDQAKAMMVAAAFIMITIIVETSLFIIKQSRDDLRRKKAMENSNPFQMGPAHPFPQELESRGKGEGRREAGGKGK